MIDLINHFICKDFSPEQVSGHLARKYKLRISHETIYKHVWSDKLSGGYLYRHLRHSNRKYRKRDGSKERRGRMKGQFSIDLRPAVVDAKRRIGDWEIDPKNCYGLIKIVFLPSLLIMVGSSAAIKIY